MDKKIDIPIFGFAILNPNLPNEYERWMELWSDSPTQEVFAHPDYVALFANGVGFPRCACLVTPLGTVMYPFLLRSIDLPNTVETGPLWI